MASPKESDSKIASQPSKPDCAEAISAEDCSSSNNQKKLPPSSPDGPHISEAEAEFYKQLLSRHLASERQLVDNGYPRPGPTPGTASFTYNNPQRKPNPVHSLGDDKFQYTCRRCKSLFVVDQSRLYQTEPCFWHYGRERKQGWRSTYECCSASGGSIGCTGAKCHVWDGRVPGKNPSGYVQTKPRSAAPSAGAPSVDKVYALDCELCYTPLGMELCRVSVIDYNLKVVLDSFVKPSTPIVDYNTRFSGVSEEDLDGVDVSLEDIQRRLLSLFSANTILVGHSLESDLKAVKIIHSRVVDTSLVFRHPRGWPFKQSLKYLAQQNLHKTIQAKRGGHDSSEDATAPMELMIKKVQDETRLSSGMLAGRFLRY